MRKEKITFWKIIERISLIVTIVGLSGVTLQMYDLRKELRKNNEKEKIIEAVAIFNVASDTIDYENAFDKFFEVKKNMKSNDTTGYSMFLGLAKREIEKVKNENNGINKYNREVERYLNYADSLNEKPNEAKNLLTDLQILKNNEK